MNTTATSTTVADVLAGLTRAEDAAFAIAIDAALDVEAFATYLAFQEIVDNYEAPGAPAGHAYVCYEAATSRLAVVDWALDVAVGTRSGLGDAAGARLLAERFLAHPDYAALVDAELERLCAALVDSGRADASAAEWARVLREHTPSLAAAPSL
ncbi:CotH kinase family protein [Demequina rhizosphaerae]|uniref:CotH kinase family protein n=1 Tax=Demequina rhizosphaerae TaxID=1638985 RepID=UPI00078030B9|nr:CotH kinase family protein [Demequina rhizosphaerae]